MQPENDGLRGSSEVPFLNRPEVFGGRFAAPWVIHEIELNLLTVIKPRHTRAFHGGDMDERVGSTSIWGNEAEPLLGIKPFHGSGGHSVFQL
jgi:hypothetical protein